MDRFTAAAIAMRPESAALLSRFDRRSPAHPTRAVARGRGRLTGPCATLAVMTRDPPPKKPERLRREVKAQLARAEELQEDGQLAAARALTDSVLALDVADDLRALAYATRADIRDDA